MPARVGSYNYLTPLKRPVLLVFSLFTLSIVISIYLYVSGFCFSKLRYYSEDELTDIAVKWNLALHNSGTERDKMYLSLAEFYQLNPQCCKVYRTSHWMLSGPGRAATGDVVINVLYKISDAAQNDKYYDSYVRLSSCGTIRETGGTMESRR